MKLESLNCQIDNVLSHTGRLKYLPRDMFLPNIDKFKVDHSMEEWLETIEERLDYKV